MVKDQPNRPDWPAVTSEAYGWELPEELAVSRRQRLRHAGPYRAAVTPEIAHLDVKLPTWLLAEAEEAAAEIARFDAEVQTALGDGELAPMSAVLLRSESAASSQIENLTVGARQLALAELGEAASRNAGIVAANVAVMTAAVDLADDITEQTILSMHATLLGRFDPRHAGQWRREQVWVGGSDVGPHGANFVAVHHSRVPAAVADLVAFARRVDLPVLPHAAIAHAQFETIHPFTDGNGRTGRALLHAMIRRARLARRVTVPLSAGLLTDTSRYFDALLAYQDGDVAPIVQQVNEAAFAATSNGRRLAQDLADVRSRWAGELTARRDAAVWRLLDLMIAQPVVTARFVSERLGVSVPAAQNALDQLVDVGALRSAQGGQRRNRVWLADDVLVTLDDFAVRAGRRSQGR